MPAIARFSVPAGYYPPFAVVSDLDHGGWIIIAASLGSAMVLLSTIIRIYIKTASRQPLGRDDILLAGGTLIAWLEESVVLAACARGLGRQVDLLSPSSLQHVEKSFYSSQILTVLSLGFCKCSVACFILRLTPWASTKTILHGILICSVIWTAASILALALQCNLTSPWSLASGVCHGAGKRVLLIGIFDVILEITLFVAAMLLVSKLQTTLHKKAAVVIAFSLRLPIIAFIAARLATFDQTGLADFALSESLYIVWTVTQINYSLISTTLPILRPCIKDLATFYGAMQPTGNSLDSSSHSCPLSSFTSRPSNGPSGSIAVPRQQSLIHDRLETFDFAVPCHAACATSTHCEADVEGGPWRGSEEPEMGVHSFGNNHSHRMMIRVENEISVERREFRR